jgi:hypothetical protein
LDFKFFPGATAGNGMGRNRGNWQPDGASPQPLQWRMNEVIAQRIIALAKRGERDIDRLCGGALIGLGDKAAKG